MDNNLIPLANCQITQTTTEKCGKGDWIVNYAGKDLYELPSSYNEKEAMAVIHFARKFELEAFNIGINFQSKKSQKLFDVERKNLLKVIAEQNQYNNKLAEKLEKFIISEE